MVVVVGLASGSAMAGSDKPVDGDQVMVALESNVPPVVVTNTSSIAQWSQQAPEKRTCLHLNCVLVVCAGAGIISEPLVKVI